MEASEIRLSDWSRFFNGEAPVAFYFEILIRMFFIYLLLMVSMRLMGKRMSSQLSRNELAALVALAAAIGVPALDPSRGLLPAVIIAFVVVLLQRLVSLWAFKDKAFEKVSQGDLNVLVNDSVMRLDEMQYSRITRERLFGQLRSEGLIHLGQVKRVYFEANGDFSLVKEPEPKPGLLVLPYSDNEFIEEKVKITDKLICMNCGNPKPENSNNSNRETKCENCGDNNWTEAVE